MQKQLMILVTTAILLGACGSGKLPPEKIKEMQQTGSLIKLTVHEVTDHQGTGRTAMTYLLPEDWSVEDSLYWQNTDAQVPVRYAATYTSPGATSKIEIYPDLRFVYEKGPMGAQGIPPPGSILNGLKKVITSVMPGIHINYLDEQMIPGIDPPGVNTGIARGQYHSERGMIKFEYEKNGQLFEEEVYGEYQTNTHSSQGVVYLEGVAWNLTDMFSVSALKGTLADCKKIALTVRSSLKPTLPFFNTLVQVVQMMQDQYYRSIYEAGQISKLISQTNDQMIAGIDAQYQSAQSANDRINQNFSDYMRGVDRYGDGTSEYQLPSGYTGAWVNPKGEYLLSTQPGFDPAAAFGEDWRSLQKK